MKTTADHLVVLCQALDVQPEPALIERLAQQLHGPTVAAMMGLITQQDDLETTFQRLVQLRMTPLEREMLQFVQEHKFVSSQELVAAKRIKQSAAVNRLRMLQDKGLVQAAFEFLPAGGGSRRYYAPANGAIDLTAIHDFALTLGQGRIRR